MKRDMTMEEGHSVLGVQPFSNPLQSFCSDLCLGEFAHTIIEQQFRYIVAQEKGVIADRDPEYLHQMRVGFRRFQAATTVFKPAIACNLSSKQVKEILKCLGTLRDLDVQLQGIRQKQNQANTPGMAKSLIGLQRDLSHQRRIASKQVRKTLTQRSNYRLFKQQIKQWLKHPAYKAIAQFPVQHCIPELLSPIISKLLLHPAWLLPQTAMTNDPAFHDLRKLCKQVRYQGEFFLSLYPKAFTTWIKEIKSIQSGLGEVQDVSVFREFIQHSQAHQMVATISTAIGWGGCAILQDWDFLKQRYTDPAYRRQIHRLILTLNP